MVLIGDLKGRQLESPFSCKMFGAILRKNSIIVNIPMYKKSYRI